MSARAALRLALAALEQSRPLATEDDFPILVREHDAAIKAARAALDGTETPTVVAQSAKFPTDEELAAKGWQRVICPACGSEMARAAPPQPVPLSPLTDDQIDAVTREQWGDQLGVMVEAHRAYARAVLSVPADSLMTHLHLQMQCSAWGAYWRASDAHGVELTRDQATELLAYALGVEVEIKQ